MLFSLNWILGISIGLQILYTLSVIGLALYNAQALWLTWQQYRHRQHRPITATPLTTWPHVAVQLPIFNEQHVVEGLIDGCASLNYAHDKLHIYVLDDSTDETTAIARARAAEWQERGVDVQVIHREKRGGFKAGALAEALPQCAGDFIAIFDADFMPAADFLNRTIPHFFGDQSARIGFLQTRWAHLNADYSPLTRSQALALDGHFAVEQAARQAAGYPCGFNGSAGIWRRACIEDSAVGGWQADTLCEDLDLSYRAQLAGWRPLYLPEVEVPAEVPPQLLAFKRQQFRWAKGSVQTLRKLAARVWQSEWSLPARIAGTLHLGMYLIHPCMLLMLLVSLPLLLLDSDPFWPLAYLSVASFGPPLLYAVGQRTLHPRTWLRRWSALPLLMLLGMGLSFNNSLAVWQAWRGQASPFLRTPKFQTNRAGEQWQQSDYVLKLDGVVVGEFLCLLYAIASVIVALVLQKWWSIPFLLVYVGGFGMMVASSLWQAYNAWRNLSADPQRPGWRMAARRGTTSGFSPVDFVKSRSR